MIVEADKYGISSTLLSPSYFKSFLQIEVVRPFSPAILFRLVWDTLNREEPLYSRSSGILGIPVLLELKRTGLASEIFSPHNSGVNKSTDCASYSKWGLLTDVLHATCIAKIIEQRLLFRVIGKDMVALALPAADTGRCFRQESISVCRLVTTIANARTTGLLIPP